MDRVSIDLATWMPYYYVNTLYGNGIGVLRHDPKIKHHRSLWRTIYRT